MKKKLDKIELIFMVLLALSPIILSVVWSVGMETRIKRIVTESGNKPKLIKAGF